MSWLRRALEVRQRLHRDLVVALRSLRRSPTFTIATVIILALGIGMSAAMFTIYKGLLIDRLPIADQDRVVIMHPLDRSGTHLDIPYSYLQAVRRDTAVFRSVAGVYHNTAIPAPYNSGTESVRLVTSVVTGNFFATLGVSPAAGRLTRDEDDQPGATQTMVLSYQAWQRRYAGSPSIIGHTITEPYNGVPIRIVGTARGTIIGVTLAVALLLIIACTNVGGLVLVRLAARQREVAVRRAIGAALGDVVRLFLIENVVLGAAGGAAGLLVAALLVRGLTLVAPASTTHLDLLQHAGAPVTVTAAVALVTTILFGLVPSFAAARVDSYAALRTDSRTGNDGKARRRARRILVAGQLALAVVLIAGAALLVRTVERLQSMDFGYDPEHLSLISFTGPQSVFSSNPRMAEVAKELLGRIETLPGIVAATPVESEPFKGVSLFIMKLMPAEQPASEGEKRPYVPFEFVGPNYFQTFRIPLLKGRSFAAGDVGGAAPVVIVNEALAQQLWPNDEAIGKRLRVVNDTSAPATVIGIARNTHFRDLRDVSPVVYFDWEQAQRFWNGYIAVRTTQPLATMLPAIRHATSELNPSISIWDAKTMDELLDRPLAQPRLSALLLTAFGLVALLVSAIGLYGLMSTAVRQQTRDIGVRVALGAQARDVRKLILGEALWVVGIGAAVGLVIAVAATRLLASQLFGVSPSDPRSLLGACGLLIATGIVAAYLPARRAARIDPVEALRTE